MSSEVTLEVVAVDDSPSVLAQFKQLVSGINGVKVVGTAKDGLEAIALLRDTKADLVVMDIVMPRMDGLTALRTLRVSNPGIRVAMLSSVAGSRSRAEEAFRLGAVQVLTKPVDPVKLRESCSRLSAQLRLPQEGENAMAVKFFGQFLVQEGVVTVDQLREGLELMDRRNRGFSGDRTEKGYLSQSQVEQLTEIENATYKTK